MDTTIGIIEQCDKRKDSDVGADVRSSETTAERVAAVLRRKITEGQLATRTQPNEERLGARLRISRTTLREAFRLLTHDGLLVHRLHRGVFVPELDAEDLVERYRLRRTIECAVVRALTSVDAPRWGRVRAAVEAAGSAATRDDWARVGTATMHFHQCLVGRGGSRRINEFTRRLLADLRLVFHAVASPKVLHGPSVSRNRALHDVVVAGQAEQAAEELRQYLRDSEEQLLSMYRARRDAAPVTAMAASGASR